jgi:hypothetical protein
MVNRHFGLDIRNLVDPEIFEPDFVSAVIDADVGFISGDLVNYDRIGLSVYFQFDFFFFILFP